MNSAKIPRRLLPLAGLLAAALLGAAIFWPRGGPPPPIYGELPEFRLTDTAGKPFSRKNLMGRVWVADLIYTRCEDTCPAQSAEMARLLGEMKGEAAFSLLSITVDPRHDTPEVLSRYAAKFGVPPGRWTLLTGPEREIAQIARKGFRLAYASKISRLGGPVRRLMEAAGGLLSPRAAHAHHPKEGAKNKLSELLSHSSRFVLLDRRARIRGYYLIDDPEALKRLRRDIPLVIKENP